LNAGHRDNHFGFARACRPPFFREKGIHPGNYHDKAAPFSTLYLGGTQRAPCGLLFCLAGDVFLIFVLSRKLFMVGLISFLTGHVLFSIAFFTMATSGTLALVIAVLCLTLSGTVAVWLRPHLGTMTIPVIAYVIIITVMVIGAASLAGNEQVSFNGRLLAFCGAILFYLSDILVARHRFVKRAYINRLVGLPLYYTAQFMIAYSIGFF
jgi:uncharacterized membrane protein YhhN